MPFAAKHAPIHAPHRWIGIAIVCLSAHFVVAYDYGWHVWRKTPRDGSPQVTVKDRYVDIWRKKEKGEWKLWMYMNNTKIETPMSDMENPQPVGESMRTFGWPSNSIH